MESKKKSAISVLESLLKDIKNDNTTVDEFGFNAESFDNHEAYSIQIEITKG